MNTQKTKREPTPQERVAYACSADEAHTNRRAPFAITWRKREWVAATDGHRAHLVRVDAAPADRGNGPPLDKVLDDFDFAPAIATVKYDCPMLAALREFPSRWNAIVDIGQGTVAASTSRGSGSMARVVRLFDGVLPAPGFELASPITDRGVASAYLVDAVDALMAGLLVIRQSSPLAPYYIHAAGVELDALTEIAVVMPCRL